MEIPQQQPVLSQSIAQVQPAVAMQQTCPFCHIAVSPAYYFCPNCGKKLKEKPLSTAAVRQIGLYLLSFFLPPFGLVPGIRYLQQKDEKAKAIGLVAIVLTFISIAVSVWIAILVMNTINKTINEQLNLYQTGGF